MRYILDTHVLLWALQDNPRLPQKIREIIIDEKNEIFVSGVSFWEISIKHKKSSMLIPFSGSEIIRFTMRAGYRLLSISVEDIDVYDKYDFGNHKDPFDCMLIAQAVNADMKIITHDIAIKNILNEKALFF